MDVLQSWLAQVRWALRWRLAFAIACVHARREAAGCVYCEQVSIHVISCGGSAGILFDLVDEVKLDASGGKPVYLAIFSISDDFFMLIEF